MKVKLIWKFYGPDCVKTANHHLIHLKDFIEESNVELFGCGVNKKNDSCETYLIVIKDNVESLRKILKPHKGVLLKNY